MTRKKKEREKKENRRAYSFRAIFFLIIPAALVNKKTAAFSPDLFISHASLSDALYFMHYGKMDLSLSIYYLRAKAFREGRSRLKTDMNFSRV